MSDIYTEMKQVADEDGFDRLIEQFNADDITTDDKLKQLFVEAEKAYWDLLNYLEFHTW